jgi:hypothetical protein
MLLIVDGGQFVRFVVNVICEDFFWLRSLIEVLLCCLVVAVDIEISVSEIFQCTY